MTFKLNPMTLAVAIWLRL